MSGERDTCEYIAVGSGAGGGTVAARLAEAGMHVILLEAGGDPRQTSVAGLPENYDVPGFHLLASEQQAMCWDFFVRHYRDDAEQRRSESQQRHKSAHDPRGIYYPRAGTLGGCTAHNAMIFVAPHDNDWNDIAKLTGDASWHVSKMRRRYLRKLENCRYKPMWRMLSLFGIDPTRRGWSGRLHTEWAHPKKALGDHELVRIVMRSACTAMLAARHPLRSLRTLLTGIGDTNFRLPGQRTFEGVCFTPLSTSSHRRLGARERILEVAKQHPDKLEIRLHARSNDPNDEDLRAVIKGIRIARRLVDLVSGHNPVMTEEMPGRHLQSDQQLADYVHDNAWGHHACGACAIGPRESSGVVDKDFKVHGTHALRVVDASVFPRIPGFFIVSAVYMIAEKAANRRARYGI